MIKNQNKSILGLGVTGIIKKWVNVKRMCKLVPYFTSNIPFLKEVYFQALISEHGRQIQSTWKEERERERDDDEVHHFLPTSHHSHMCFPNQNNSACSRREETANRGKRSTVSISKRARLVAFLSKEQKRLSRVLIFPVHPLWLCGLHLVKSFPCHWHGAR